MANCDEGYNCDRCGEYVKNVQVSELYLRYVLGVVPIEELPREPERHIRCAPEFAQFIVDKDFEPVACDDPALDKRNLPDAVRLRQERLFTKAWKRLQEVAASQIPVNEYPLSALNLDAP
jgi:hypothetical protein